MTLRQELADEYHFKKKHIKELILDVEKRLANIGQIEWNQYGRPLQSELDQLRGRLQGIEECDDTMMKITAKRIGEQMNLS